MARLEKKPKPAPENPDVVTWNDVYSRSTTRRLETLDKLKADGKINAQLYCAGMDYLRIVETFYTATSSLSRLSEEAPHAGGDNDPIKRYTKGRRVYIPTQRPRNVARTRTSFDGWSATRCDALGEMKRLRMVLGQIDGEALLALYALVIHPSKPGERPESLRAYVVRRYGYRNQRTEDRVTQALAVSLTALHHEYGEQLEEAA